MSIFIQEVLGLLKRNQKKITLDKSRDWFEFGKLYQTSILNTGASYNPKMDPFVIKWGDLVCQATEDLTRTLPGQGNLGFVPVYTDPSGYCNWDTLKDSIITQNALNTIITIGGNLVVTGDVAINGCDLTSTCTTFNLLNTGPVSFINFGGSSSLIEMSNAGGIVNVNGTAQSTSCTTGALVVKGGVGIAKDLFVCGDANIAGDAAINGGDLTSTVTTFNLLNSVTNINFGNASQNILIGGLNATSDVTIVGTQESTTCTNGAFVVSGGVGIAKNLNVCGNLTVTGTSNLNGDVNLGDALGDNIRLFGILLDNNGSTALANQVLIAQTGGSALWTSPPWIISFAVAGNTGTPFDITQANTLSILGGTALTTVTSSVDTVTINHLDYGTAGVYAYPSSITTNAQGHVISIVSGTNPTITADNGLTMSTATNVQLGGTLIQTTTIATAGNNFTINNLAGATIPTLTINSLSTNSGGHGLSVSSANAFAGYFTTNIGLGALFASNNGTTPAVTFLQSNGYSVAKFTRSGINNTGIGTILDLYNTCNAGPAVVGLGASINFNIEDDLSAPSYAGHIAFDWTSFTLGNTSRFTVETVNQGTDSIKLEVAGSGQLKLNEYGAGIHGGTPVYNLSVTSTGDVIETFMSVAPKVFVALISQSGIAIVPTMTIVSDFSAGAITFTWSYVSPGLYTLQADQPIFFATKTAFYITPDVNVAKSYCAAIERQTDTLLLVNSWVSNTGVSENDCFNNATLKIEIY
jgi:hypothetical protein